ncbi:hypothetical protein FQZ97_1012260 [compost metagenome]
MSSSALTVTSFSVVAAVCASATPDSDARAAPASSERGHSGREGVAVRVAVREEGFMLSGCACSWRAAPRRGSRTRQRPSSRETKGVVVPCLELEMSG